MRRGLLSRTAAVALVAAAAVAPAAGAQDFAAEVVPGSADVLDPSLTAGDALYLAGRRPPSSLADTPVLVRRLGGWSPVAPPTAPRRPAEQAAVTAAGASALRLDVGSALVSSTAYEANGSRAVASGPIAEASTAAAPCAAAGASRVAVAAAGADVVSAVTTLPRDPTLFRAFAVGTTRGATTTWRCSATPVTYTGRPAVDGNGRFAVPVVRPVRGATRLLLSTGEVGDPADRPLVEEELGPVGGTALACDAQDANLGTVAWGGDGARYAAAVAEDGSSVRLWRGTEPLDVPMGAAVASLELVRDPAGGVLLAAATSAAGCLERALRLLRVASDASGVPVVAADAAAATGLAPGCSGRLGLAEQDGRAQIAVQVGTAGDCTASATAGRHVLLLSEQPAAPRATRRAEPAAAAAGRSRAAERAHRAR